MDSTIFLSQIHAMLHYEKPTRSKVIATCIILFSPFVQLYTTKSGEDSQTRLQTYAVQWSVLS